MAEKSSESIIKNLKLIKDLIYFMNLNKFDKLIEKLIMDFSNLQNEVQKYTAIFIPFCIDIAYANDFASELSTELIFNPYIFLSEVKKLVGRLISTFLDKTIQLDQIFVQIIPSSLPIEKEIFPNGLCSFQGVLIEHSELQKYIKSTVWECPNHKVAIFRSELISNEKCDVCGEFLQENVPYRTMGEMRVCTFIDLNALKMNRFGRYQSVTVEIRDITKCEIELGAIYTITGVKEHNFIAWNCEKYIYRPIVLKYNDIFKKFAEFREQSPWTFVYALSMFIATENYPPMLFTNLKIGILLSLASLNEKSKPVPIFAFGNDTLTAHNLFWSVANFANRFVCSTVNQNILNQKRTEFYEANILVLSQNGVCYLGDWEKYQKEKDAYVIRSAVESNTINYEDFSIPLKSTVWTYWTKSTKTKNLKQLQTLINVFGIPFISDPLEDEEELVDYILSKNITNSKFDDFFLKTDHMRQYLHSVSLQNVIVSESAQKLLSDYFVASRKLRPGCLPIRALEHMSSLAEAHARLNLRTEVMCEDVILVISLYEEAIEVIFGQYPILPIYNKNIKYIDDVDIEMARFSAWLHEFLLISQTEN